MEIMEKRHNKTMDIISRGDFSDMPIRSEGDLSQFLLTT